MKLSRKKLFSSFILIIVAVLCFAMSACNPEEGSDKTELPTKVIVTELEIVREPVKTEYYAGESFDSKGMVLRAIWSDGRKQTVVPAKCQITPESALTALTPDVTKLTFTYEGVSVDQPITVSVRNLLSLTVDSSKLPAKIPSVGADLSGIAVTAFYDNDTTETISDYILKIEGKEVEDISDVSGLSAGTNIATVEYMGLTQSFTMEVFNGFNIEAENYTECKPASGHVSTVANETYSGGAGIGWIYSGDCTIYKDVEFDGENLPTQFIMYYKASGTPEISVRLDGEDGTEIARFKGTSDTDIHTATAQLSDLTAGKHDVYLCFVSKGGNSDYVEVDYFSFVKEDAGISKEVKSIAITKAPDKTVYKQGEKFDATGMVVTATFTDGVTAQISDYTYTPDGALSVDDNKITIAYQGKTVDQPITVEEKIVVKVEAENFFEKNPSDPNSQVQIVNKPGWSGDKAIGWINPGNFTAYNVNFEDGNAFTKLTLYYACNNNSLKVTVRLGSTEGDVLADFTLQNTNNQRTAFTVDLSDSTLNGEQKIYFCFGDGGADIDYFEFLN